MENFYNKFLINGEEPGGGAYGGWRLANDVFKTAIIN